MTFFQRLIIVGGAPRSGTTLLQNMLDTHPDVYGGPEFGELPKIAALRRAMHRSVLTGRITAYVDGETVDRGLRDLVEQWLRPALERSGAQRLSEKSPGNALVLSDLGELFPEATAIHVVRDPRAVVASLLRVRGRHGNMPFPDALRSVDEMTASSTPAWVTK